MAALTDRKAARERLLSMFQSALDRAIPADEREPLKGSTFADFEQVCYEVGRPVVAALVEERAKLEPNAQVEQAGRCPLCGSERTYLKKQSIQEERISPTGPLVIQKQSARCRACNGSFSPSGA